MTRKWLHGRSQGGDRTYKSWCHMISRCSNPKDAKYAIYGGRGILACSEWQDFREFLKDMGDVPVGRSLGRIDNDKGYCKSNCRWETVEQQLYNRRRQANNKTGIAGVSRYGLRFLAYFYRGSRNQIRLYSGLDFFEACCARKSWEAKTLNLGGV